MESTFKIHALRDQDGVDRVMFELQDLPCISQVQVSLETGLAWVEHTPMIGTAELMHAIAEAGFESEPL